MLNFDLHRLERLKPPHPTLVKSYRFRMVSTLSGNCMYQFSIDNHYLKIIGFDGNFVEPKTVKTITTGPAGCFFFSFHPKTWIFNHMNNKINFRTYIFFFCYPPSTGIRTDFIVYAISLPRISVPSTWSLNQWTVVWVVLYPRLHTWYMMIVAGEHDKRFYRNGKNKIFFLQFYFILWWKFPSTKDWYSIS